MCFSFLLAVQDGSKDNRLINGVKRKIFSSNAKPAPPKVSTSFVQFNTCLSPVTFVFNAFVFNLFLKCILFYFSSK